MEMAARRQGGQHDRMTILIYETTDLDFANTALEALEEARIRCYSTGGENPYGRSHTYCLYILNPADRARANAILVSLGAAQDVELRMPNSWQFRVGLAVFVMLLVAAIAWVVSG